MRVLLAGTPAIALPIFDSVFNSDLEILGVITNPPRSRGRSSALLPSPVSEWAKRRNLPVFDSGDLDEVLPLLHSADAVLVVAYGRLIPERLLTIPKYGWLNIHFSHLPEARGAAPVQRLIEAGAETIGFTLFRLDSGMDTGPIFYRSRQIPINDQSTGEMWDALSSDAANHIVELLKEIGLGKEPRIQEPYHGRVATAPKITTEEARIDWTESSVRILRKIRAFNPAPSTWTTFRGARFIIHSATDSADSVGGAGSSGLVGTNPGSITKHNVSIYVTTSDGAIALTHVQPAGKRSMSAQEWFRGVSEIPGTSHDAGLTFE